MYGNWRIKYGNIDHVFGTSDSPVKFVSAQFAADSFRVGDASLPRTDGIAFGSDYVDPGELRIDLRIDYTSAPLSAEDRARLASEAQAEFAQVWRADELRADPRSVAELILGGEKMIEGRPRRINWDTRHQGLGLINGTAAFVPSSMATYSVDENGVAVWQETSIGIVPSAQGGLIAPLIAPLSTSRQSSRARSFVVGGEVPVWPVVEVRGPVQSGASVELVGLWEMKLNRSLAYDDVVLIDTRPGRKSTRLNGAPANVLDPVSVWLSDACIPPGPQSLAMRGKSVEGTAATRLLWREQKAG